jgi:hypothetical protein
MSVRLKDVYLDIPEVLYEIILDFLVKSKKNIKKSKNIVLKELIYYHYLKKQFNLFPWIERIQLYICKNIMKRCNWEEVMNKIKSCTIEDIEKYYEENEKLKKKNKILFTIFNNEVNYYLFRGSETPEKKKNILKKKYFKEKMIFFIRFLSIRKKMSGHADYSFSLKELKTIELEVLLATEENTKPYGHIVYDMNEEPVKVKFPYDGKRDYYGGDEAPITTGNFSSYQTEDYYYANNESVPNGDYIIGKKIGNYVYVREANYHLCGGQIIFSKEHPFFLLLGKGENIQPEEFKIFFFEKGFGFHIDPNIWHQPPYSKEKIILFNKQSSIHSCVLFDSIKEFSCVMKFSM